MVSFDSSDSHWNYAYLGSSSLFFFSNNPEQQFKELKSTWLRSFLALIIGAASGIALNRNKHLAPLLWAGILLSFIFLIYQYIPKALSNKSIFAIDWFGDYIYLAKFNGVLAGIILIAGLLGLSIDLLLQIVNEGKQKDDFKVFNSDSKFNNNPTKSIKNLYFIDQIKLDQIKKISILIYIFIGISIPIFAFVFIFDAKLGVGISFILIAAVLTFGVIQITKNFMLEINSKHKKDLLKRSIIILVLVSIFLSWYASHHYKKNPNWHNLIEDLSIGVQIEKYQNWKNPFELGLPLRADGSKVEGSAYVRMAWARLGIEKILKDPIGFGVSRNFAIQVNDQAPNLSQVTSYSHSAWIDIGLTFGIPGLLLLPIALIIFLIIAIFNQRIFFKGTITILIITIMILYLLGEQGFQHGIEILFYFCGLISSLTLASLVKK